MKNYWPILIAAFAALTCGAGSIAAEGGKPLEGQLLDESEGFRAIALYPEEIRNAILEATTHPELIVKAAAVQEKSSAAFAQLLAGYSREDKEAIWNLVRFPGLVEKLVEGGIKSRAQIEQIVEEYPAEIRAAASKYGRQEYDLLAEIRELNQSADETFAALLAEYPESTRQDFRKLIRHPEVMTILQDEMRLTVLLGAAYEKDPEGVKQQAVELNLRLAREHAAAIKDSPKGAESGYIPEYANPAESGKWEKVARTYAGRYRYDTSGFDGPDTEVDVSVTHYDYPYPYWFGYPHWRVYPGWYAGFNWYITPALRASVAWSPGHLYAPYYHRATWSRGRMAPPARRVRTPPRREIRRR